MVEIQTWVWQTEHHADAECAAAEIEYCSGSEYSSRTVNGLHLACRSLETGWRSGTDSQGHREYINEDVRQAITSGCHLPLCSLNRSRSLLLHHTSSTILLIPPSRQCYLLISWNDITCSNVLSKHLISPISNSCVLNFEPRCGCNLRDSSVIFLWHLWPSDLVGRPTPW